MKNLREILSGDNPVAELRAMFNNGLLAQLEPSLADLRMELPRGVHHKDNLEHSFQVLQNAIDRETDGVDLVLRTAALFHDIGKPATRKFGARKSVTFDGHEMVGAKIVRKVLPKHGYSNVEVQKIAKITALHMRSHGFGVSDWSDSAVRRLITDAGSDEILQKLIIVFYADSTTKHEHKLNKHHEGIRKLTEEIARVAAVDARKALRPALDGFEVMELFNLTAGRELGAIMKFLNTDEGVTMSRDEAIAYIQENFIK